MKLDSVFVFVKFLLQTDCPKLNELLKNLKMTNSFKYLKFTKKLIQELDHTSNYNIKYF
jgi:hypothetical protein